MAVKSAASAAPVVDHSRAIIWHVRSTFCAGSANNLLWRSHLAKERPTCKTLYASRSPPRKAATLLLKAGSCVCSRRHSSGPPPILATAREGARLGPDNAATTTPAA